jgi:cephalosporin-C deacetylase-like acetyl esterase
MAASRLVAEPAVADAAGLAGATFTNGGGATAAVAALGARLEKETAYTPRLGALPREFTQARADPSQRAFHGTRV